MGENNQSSKSSNQQRSVYERTVPWSNWDEWTLVYQQLYSEDLLQRWNALKMVD